MSGPMRITRRQLVGLIAAAPLAILPLAPADPIAAAFDELVEASLAWERSHAATGDDGAGIVPWVRRVADVDRRLQAAYGAEAGSDMWMEAMERHRLWQIERYGLPDDA